MLVDKKKRRRDSLIRPFLGDYINAGNNSYVARASLPLRSL